MKIKSFLTLFSTSLMFPAVALAVSPKTELCSSDAGLKANCDPVAGKDLSGLIGNITDTLLFIAGAIAVLIIIAGGIMYITSTGEAKRIQQAKDTILYAVIGLVVIILAYAIVGFTIKAISK